jgi:hypothetical protein
VTVAVWEDGSMHVLVREGDTLKAVKDGGTIYSPHDMIMYVTLSERERRMLHQFKKRFGGVVEWSGDPHDERKRWRFVEGKYK